MGYFHRTAFLGHDIALFLPDPNWESSVDVTYRIKARIESGQTRRENRKPRHFVTRHELRASWTLAGEDFASLQASLADLGAAYVGMPLAPDALPVAVWADRIHEASWVINYDSTGFAIYAKEAIPQAPARQFLAPLIVGRLSERPKLKLATPDRARFDLKLIERSPREFAIAPVAAAVGADWPGALDVDWSTVPEDATDDALVYEDLGDGRVEAISGQEGATRRLQAFQVTMLSRAEIRTLLNFFQAKKGRIGSFLVPWCAQPGDDTPEHPHQTRVRFSDDAITLKYQNGAVAEASVSLVQVPWEVEGVAGEVPEQAPDAYLYRFSVDVPGGPIYWRFTNWESDLTRIEEGVPAIYKGDTHSLIEHDKIVRTSDLYDEATTITSWIFDTNPVLKIVQRTLDAPLAIEIFRVDPAAPQAAELLYAGEIGEVEIEGRKLKASTQVMGGALEVKVPNFYYGPNCNYQLCGAGCNVGGSMPAADWTFAGTVAAIAENSLVVTVTANPKGVALAENWVANGWLKKGAGEAFEIRKIVSSTAAAGGQLTLVLKRALLACAVGDVVTFFPYCSGTRSECREKFGNYINFGGHFDIAPNNLSMPAMEVGTGGGKK